MKRVVPKFKTIRSYVEHLLVETVFVDCWGRRVGLDYPTILTMVRAKFPKGRTSFQSMRQNLYTLDRSIRLPVRRRSHKILAREYARALLLQRDSEGLGLNLKVISRKVRRQYPKAPIITDKQLAQMIPPLRKEFRSRMPDARR